MTQKPHHRSSFSRISDAKPRNKVIGLEPYRRLGQVIHDARLQENLFQWQLAEQIGLCNEAIGYIEKGKRRLDVIEYWAIVKTLKNRNPAFSEQDELLQQVLRFDLTLPD